MRAEVAARWPEPILVLHERYFRSFAGLFTVLLSLLSTHLLGLSSGRGHVTWL